MERKDEFNHAGERIEKAWHAIWLWGQDRDVPKTSLRFSYFCYLHSYQKP